MGRTYVNPITAAIEWATVSNIAKGKDGQVRITLSGSLLGSTLTAETVIGLVPAQPPAVLVGATMAAYLYLSESSATFGEDGIWQITADFQGTATSESGSNDPQGDADNVFYETRVSSVEQDIATHPAFADYGAADKAAIAGLLSGEVVPNVQYTGTGTGITTWEFIRFEGQLNVPTNVPFTSAGDGLTPLEMARRIARGVRTYFRPTVILTRTWTQQTALSSALYEAVSQVALVPGRPPPDGREWFLLGYTETQLAENAYRITAEYQLSDEGGVDDLLYG